MAMPSAYLTLRRRRQQTRPRLHRRPRHRPHDAAIVAAVITLAAHPSLGVTAEGVEPPHTPTTGGAWPPVRAGYLFARPAAANTTHTIAAALTTPRRHTPRSRRS